MDFRKIKIDFRKLKIDFQKVEIDFGKLKILEIQNVSKQKLYCLIFQSRNMFNEAKQAEKKLLFSKILKGNI
jgi:hypothetical protein